MDQTSVLGIILAGGAARRMGGGDKGLLPLGQSTLLQSVRDRLLPQCNLLVLNANGNPARFSHLSLPVVADSLPGLLGPLAGVLAGMDEAARQGFPWVLSAAADTPFLPLDLFDRLRQARDHSAHPIALACTGPTDHRTPHPTFGLWPVALRENLRTALQDGLSRPRLWAEQQGTAWAWFATEPIDPFFNVNTPADLAQANMLLADLPALDPPTTPGA